MGKHESKHKTMSSEQLLTVVLSVPAYRTSFSLSGLKDETVVENIAPQRTKPALAIQCRGLMPLYTQLPPQD